MIRRRRKTDGMNRKTSDTKPYFQSLIKKTTNQKRAHSLSQSETKNVRSKMFFISKNAATLITPEYQTDQHSTKKEKEKKESIKI